MALGQFVLYLRADERGHPRAHHYDGSLSDDGGDMLTGTGFAFDGAARCSYGKLTAVIESGIIEIFTALGVEIGTLFIIGWIGAGAVSFSRPADATRT